MRVAVGSGRGDEIGAAGEEAGILRTAQTLAAAEDDQIGAPASPLPQVIDGRDGRGGVDDDRHLPGMGDGDNGREIESAGVGVAGIDVENSRRLWGDSLLQFLRLGPLRGADFDQPAAGDAEHLVVIDAVGAVDDDLVRHPVAVGESADALGSLPAMQAAAAMTMAAAEPQVT